MHIRVGTVTEQAVAAEWRAVEPHVKKTFLPIFWVEERSQATSEQCSSFKSQVLSW